MDDPLNPEEALSEAYRRGANEWFDHTLYSLAQRCEGDDGELVGDRRRHFC
jgi:hypothetical protein